MKIMVASDIHGSDYYCKKMLEAFKKENADKLLLLGDLLYHGPRNDLPKGYEPKKVIERLNAMKDKILCVRGNCDTEVDQMVLSFPILADYSILYLENRMILATHGHKFNEETLPPLENGDILLCGHTHIPKCEKKETYIYMNTGSISIPKEDSPNSYMIIENNSVKWKRLNNEVFLEYSL